MLNPSPSTRPEPVCDTPGRERIASPIVVGWAIASWRSLMTDTACGVWLATALRPVLTTIGSSTNDALSCASAAGAATTPNTARTIGPFFITNPQETFHALAAVPEIGTRGRSISDLLQSETL